MYKNVSAKQVEAFTMRKISQLIASAKENTRNLAELRRGIGKAPGEIPQLWGYFLESMPEEFYGEEKPSRAEWAVYTAITLFALHQQGKDPEKEPMHRPEQTFGKAVAMLIKDDDDRERISRRFYTVATSSSMEELSHYMRSIVQLLRAEGIGLDYSKLARDIFYFQFPERISSVRLKWGQDFYGKIKKDEQNQKQEEEK